ncbi:MAG: hypothetical protein HRU09_07495 [Oligoflexales bacterium]|nr:hypothetical protein [Oligoflexales bacterium]
MFIYRYLLLVALITLNIQGLAFGQKSYKRIAVLVPQNGENAAYGDLQMKGYTLAEIDLARSLKSIKVRYFDTGKAIPSTRLLFNKKVLQEWKPDLIIGPYSSELSKETIELLAKQPIPIILPYATLDSIPESGKKNVFRTAVPAGVLSKTLMSFSKVHAKSHLSNGILVIAEDSLFAKDFYHSLKKVYKKVEYLGYNSRILSQEAKKKKLIANKVVVLIHRNPLIASKLTRQLSGENTVVGYAGGFLTPIFHQYLKTFSDKFYLLSPLSSDSQNPDMAAFSKRFKLKYGEGSWALGPSYHSIKAYSALQVGAKAIEASQNSGMPLLKALRHYSFPSIEGPIEFDYFDHYEQQAAVEPQMIRFEKGSIQSVVLEAEKQYSQAQIISSTKKQEKSDSPIGLMQILLGNQFISLFCIICLGLILGKIRIGGISLDSSGILFIALIFGHFHFTIPSGVGNLGLVFFIFSVGVSAGPTFFTTLIAHGTSLVKTSIFMVFLASLTIIFSCYAFNIPRDLAIGIFAGSTSSTPALAAALDLLRDLEFNKKMQN